MKHRIKVFLSVTASAILLLEPPLAYALPTGGQVAGGQASISSLNNTMTINQSSQKAIINWNSFNIGNSESVQFVQPSSSAIALNRINDTQASTIDGQLLANGNVWLLNPNGVLFGKNAQVNVGGLLATTSTINNNDFMSGLYNFAPGGNPNATISNAGSISVIQGGLADFVAPNVINSGIINAKLGKVALASGDSFTLDMYGDNLINLQISNNVESQLVANHGTINADGGVVTLTTAAATSVVNGLINMDGIIQANSVGTQDGQVVLYAAGSNAIAGNVTADKGAASGSSTTLVSGIINASGYGTGQTGGKVQVLGDNVGILSGAKIDTSGDAGGGVIRVGGDYHGQGTTPTAKNTIVQSGTRLLANAVANGNGGDVTVWADNSTAFAGAIEAMGGASSGNGGFVETSGKQFLGVSGSVVASAPKGMAGTWLMDPNNVTISTGSTTNMGSSPNFIDSGSPANVSTVDILSALDSGTSVNVTASGSISVNNSIAESAYSGTESLTLAAGSDISLASNVGITASGSAKLNVTLDSNTAGGGGAIVMNSGSSITSNGGNITLGGGVNPSIDPAVGGISTNTGIGLTGVSISAGSGNVIMNGMGYNQFTGNNGIELNDSQISTTSGNITLVGTGGAADSSNVGIYLKTTSATTSISSNGGAISLTGYGGNATGSTNYGIEMDGDSHITGTGNSGISLNAMGGGTGLGAALAVISTSAGISTQNGNITLSGQGPNNTGNDDVGIYTVGQISSTGTGGITMSGTAGTGTGSGNNGIDIWGGAVEVNNGNLSITGNGGANGGNIGVDIEGATVSSAGTGNILINGTGGSGSNANGIAVMNSQVTSVSGNITMGGTGGSGGNNSNGIDLDGAGGTTIISSSAGAISLTGTGGSGTGQVDLGIVLNNAAQVTATNNATISLNGTGGGSYVGMGVALNSIAAVVSTQNGDINITGHGANNPSGYGIGVYIGNRAPAYITSTGTGAINITGTANAISGTGDNDGVDIWGGIISANNGNVTITGQGAGNAQGAGVYLQNSASISSTGNGTISVSGTGAGAGSSDGILFNGAQLTSAGSNIILDGTGGAVGSSNNGINFAGNTNTISSSGGAISLTGIGGSDITGQTNQGILFNGNSSITGSGNSIISLDGTGGGNYVGIGVVLNQSSTSVTTQNGDIAITGLGGGGAAGYNIGVLVGDNNTAEVSSTGTGKITISGTAGAGTGGGNNNGVDIWSGVVTSASGNIAITGHGGINNGDTGIDLSNSANVNSTGIANIALTGIAGAAGLYGITSSGGSNVLGGGSMTGNLTLTADSLNLSALSMSTAGTVSFLPYTTSTTIGVAGGSGNLNISSAILGDISAAGNVVIGNTADTGLMNVGSFNWGMPVTFNNGTNDIDISNGSGALSFAHALYANTTTGNVNLTASSGIAMTGGGSITTQGGNITFDADTGGSGGEIIQSFVNIASNGGNIILGGGANPAIDSAAGNSSDYAGISLVNGSLNAGTGSISLIGTGWSSAGTNGLAGIFLSSFEHISTSSGNITMNGTGGAGLSDNYGIDIESSSTVSSSAGNISLTGQSDATGGGNHNVGVRIYNNGQVNATGNATISISGTGGASSGNDYGVFVTGNGSINGQNGNVTITGQGGSGNSQYNNGIVLGEGAGDVAIASMTGNGTLTLNGTGGVGLGDHDYGVILDAGTISVANGNVNITGQGGINGGSYDFGLFLADSAGITSTGSSNISMTGVAGGGTATGIITSGGSIVVGGSSMTGNLSFATDGINFNNTSISTTGTITLKPYTNSTTIGINGGAGTLSDANSDFLALINTGTVSPSQVIIGNTASGTGAVTIGSGWNAGGYSFPINVYGGSIVSSSITGGNHPLLLDALAGNITLNSGSVLTSTSTGTGLTLVAANNFINNSNSSAISDANGQWLVYSTNPASNTLNGLTAGFDRYNCTFGGSCPAFPATGSGLLYSYTPTLTATPNTINLTYGDAIPNLSGYAYTLTGYLGSDAGSDAISGSLNGTTAYAQYDNVGSYNINHSNGTLSSILGYAITYANVPTAIVVSPKILTAALTGLVDKVYDGNNQATLSAGNYSLSGIIHSDNVTLNDPVSGTYDNANIGTSKTVSISGLLLTGTKAGDYALASGSISGAVGEIDSASVSASTSAQIPSTVKFISSGTAAPTYINGLQDYLELPTTSDISGLYGVYGNSSPLNVQQHNHTDTSSTFIPLAQKFKIDCRNSNAAKCHH